MAVEGDLDVLVGTGAAAEEQVHGPAAGHPPGPVEGAQQRADLTRNQKAGRIVGRGASAHAGIYCRSARSMRAICRS